MVDQENAESEQGMTMDEIRERLARLRKDREEEDEKSEDEAGGDDDDRGGGGGGTGGSKGGSGGRGGAGGGDSGAADTSGGEGEDGANGNTAGDASINVEDISWTIRGGQLSRMLWSIIRPVLVEFDPFVAKPSPIRVAH